MKITLLDEQCECFLVDLGRCKYLLDFPLKYTINNKIRFDESKVHTNDTINSSQVYPCLLDELKNIKLQIPKVDRTDLAEIQFVLVSNMYTLLALPFLTRDPRFKAAIYTTVPLLELARYAMYELVDNQNSSMAHTNFDKELLNINNSMAESMTSENNCHMYNYDNVDHCLDRIRSLSFYESVSVGNDFNITPISSGYMIGSCNWILNYKGTKICYMSASSVLKTQSQSMQKQFLDNADVLIASHLTQQVLQPNKSLSAIASKLMKQLNNHCSVIFPCICYGLIFELIEFLSSLIMNSRLSFDVPIYIVSRHARGSLRRVHSFFEWFNSNKSTALFKDTYPLDILELENDGRIIYLNSFSDDRKTHFQQPSIIFATDPTLLSGSIVEFLKTLKMTHFHHSSSLQPTSVFITDPYYSLTSFMDNLEDCIYKIESDLPTQTIKENGSSGDDASTSSQLSDSESSDSDEIAILPANTKSHNDIYINTITNNSSPSFQLNNIVTSNDKKNQNFEESAKNNEFANQSYKINDFISLNSKINGADISKVDALGPLNGQHAHPTTVKIHNCIIDTRLSLGQFETLLTELTPKVVVLPEKTRSQFVKIMNSSDSNHSLPNLEIVGVEPLETRSFSNLECFYTDIYLDIDNLNVETDVSENTFLSGFIKSHHSKLVYHCQDTSPVFWLSQEESGVDAEKLLKSRLSKKKLKSSLAALNYDQTVGDHVDNSFNSISNIENNIGWDLLDRFTISDSDDQDQGKSQLFSIQKEDENLHIQFNCTIGQDCNWSNIEVILEQLFSNNQQ